MNGMRTGVYQTEIVLWQFWGIRDNYGDKVVVFTNKGREKNERAPDYVVYRSEDAETKKVEKVAEEATKEVVAEAQVDVNEDVPEELF